MPRPTANPREQRDFAAEPSDDPPTLARVGELHLNALPLTLVGATAQPVALVLARDDERDKELSRHANRGTTWQHYAYAKRSYAWSLVGDELPDAFDRRRSGIGMPVRLSRRRVNLAQQVMDGLPDGVGAFAAIAL